MWSWLPSSADRAQATDPHADRVNFQYVSYSPQSHLSREREGSICSLGVTEPGRMRPPRPLALRPRGRERGFSPGLPGCLSQLQRQPARGLGRDLNLSFFTCKTETKMRALLRAQGSSCPQRSSEAWAETTVSAQLQPEPGAREGTGSVPSPSVPSRPSPPGTWRSCLWADAERQLSLLPGTDREQHLPQAPRGPRGLRPSILGLRLGGHRGHSAHTHVPTPTCATPPAPQLMGQVGEDRAC